MQNFDYRKISSLDEAAKASSAKIKFLAGGTTLIDLMKLDVETPQLVLDINALPLKEVGKTPAGGIQIGALVTNSDLANHPLVKKDYPVLAQAILAGASAQLRNKATTSGNLLQRTRCVYFRDTSKPCNKRTPKSGCSAIGGHNRNLAILGTSASCIANNPSDMNVAMTVLEAKIQIQGTAGSREVDVKDFYLLPGDTPHLEHALQPGEVITGVVLPPPSAGSKSFYLKLRDRASYEFALASAAVIVTVKSGKFEKARIAMGGIGARPWRALEAEKVLEGASVAEERFHQAAAELLKQAKPQSENAFKVELAKRCLVHALKQVT